MYPSKPTLAPLRKESLLFSSLLVGYSLRVVHEMKTERKIVFSVVYFFRTRHVEISPRCFTIERLIEVSHFRYKPRTLRRQAHTHTCSCMKLQANSHLRGELCIHRETRTRHGDTQHDRITTSNERVGVEAHLLFLSSIWNTAGRRRLLE